MKQFSLRLVWGRQDSGDVGQGVVDPGVVDPGVVDPGVVDPGVVDPGVVDPGETDAGAAAAVRQDISYTQTLSFTFAALNLCLLTLSKPTLR